MAKQKKSNHPVFLFRRHWERMKSAKKLVSVFKESRDSANSVK
jgi:hypothetical protein